MFSFIVMHLDESNIREVDAPNEQEAARRYAEIELVDACDDNCYGNVVVVNQMSHFFVEAWPGGSSAKPLSEVEAIAFAAEDWS